MLSSSSMPSPVTLSSGSTASTLAFSSPASFMAASSMSAATSSPTVAVPPLSSVHPLSITTSSSFSTSASALSVAVGSGAVVHSGVLLKRQPLFNWSERFVILTTAEFFWYKRDRHSPQPTPFHHAAPSMSSMLSSPSPAPSPSPALWGEERGHWYVSDMAIRYESEKRSFILVNTNMSASVQHFSGKDNSADKDRESQHEIHLKASNDFDYLAWQHAFQQVIRIQESKKARRTRKPADTPKSKTARVEDAKEISQQEEVDGDGNEERLRKIAAILPVHQRNNSAPFSPSSTPKPAAESVSRSSRARQLTHPTLTPPPSCTSASSVASTHMHSFASESPASLHYHSVEQRSKDGTDSAGCSPQKRKSSTESKRGEDGLPQVRKSSGESRWPGCAPSIYLVSVLVPPALTSLISPGLHSSVLPHLLWPSSTHASGSSEFVVHRPLSSSAANSSSSSSSSSSLFPFSFLLPAALRPSASLQFTMADGSLLNMPLTRLSDASVISGRSEGEMTVSNASSSVEVQLHWADRQHKGGTSKSGDTLNRQAMSPSVSGCSCVLLALILLCSMLQCYSAVSSSIALLLSCILSAAFLLFTGVQNMLWSSERLQLSNYCVLTVKGVRLREKVAVDLTAAAAAAVDSKTLRKRVLSTTKRLSIPLSAAPSGFVAVRKAEPRSDRGNDSSA